MATVTTNNLIDGIRGKLGKSLVFRTMYGKTFVSHVARRPDKKKVSEAQRHTRTNFREATEFARRTLRDPEKKVYYQKRAKALKLPNAYTAAITDYMRKSRVMKTEHHGTITYSVNKSGFGLRNVRVMASETTEARPENVEIRQHKDTWLVHYTPINDTPSSLTLIITDNFKREIVIQCI